MDTELDYDLTPNQWEALRALRAPAALERACNPMILNQLVALKLAATQDNLPVMTPRGRKVLIRGSSRLWDMTA